MRSIYHCTIAAEVYPLQPPPHAGLRHLARFYVDLLGFTVEWEPDPDNIYLTSGTDNLALHRAPSDAPPEHSPLDHLGLIVRNADDVDRWASFLEANGVTLLARPKTHRDGARSCYFADPDGNRIQIIHHPPISQR
jgi:catechol 2,3-dioxygenase-like lactoylglutathione lyase family enzyme